VTENTASTTGAVESGTGKSPEQTTTTAGGDAAGKGLLDRIDGLTAERNRLKEQLEAERKKHQTDDEKRLEALAEAKYGDKMQRLSLLESHLTTKRDEMLKAVPAEYAPYIDSDAPVEKQIQQIETITSILSEKKGMPATGVAGTAASSEGAPITRDEYARVTALAGSHDPRDREEYAKRWPAIKAAIESGKLKLKR